VTLPRRLQRLLVAAFKAVAMILCDKRFPQFEACQTLYRQLKRGLIGELRERGILGTLRLLPGRGPSYFRTLVFDVIQGVDTSPALDTAGNTKPDATNKKDVVGENWVYGLGHQPTTVGAFERMIGASDIEPHCYSFLDYGSGKGRVLLLASRLPFRRVVGVEYSPELHRIAERNLHSRRFVSRRSGPVDSICIDAVRYSIPEEPIVLYFFNPFERPIMKIVRDNVVRSYEDNPRSMVVIYYLPLYSDVWDEVGFLKRYAWSNEVLPEHGLPQYIIYKTSPDLRGQGSEELG
jgi:SAM-dependent methyltransferase